MPPTTYRPVQARPAVAAKKSNPYLIGLIACAVVAVAGLGVAGLMWSGKTAAQATALQHEDSASALAKTLGVSLVTDTNLPVNWTAAWSSMDKAANDQKKELGDVKVQAATLEEQLTTLQTTVTELGDVKAKGDQAAAQLKQRTAELEALKQAQQAEVADLQAKLTAAQTAQAEAEAAAQAAREASAAAAAATTAPAGTDAAATDARVTAPAADGTTPAAPDAVEGEEVEEAAVMRTTQHTYAEGTTKLVQKLAYDEAGQIMKVNLTDGTELVYRTVPGDLIERLISAPVPDTYFRLHVVGVYPCTPDDKATIRAFNKKR